MFAGICIRSKLIRADYATCVIKDDEPVTNSLHIRMHNYPAKGGEEAN